MKEPRTGGAERDFWFGLGCAAGMGAAFYVVCALHETPLLAVLAARATPDWLEAIGGVVSGVGSIFAVVIAVRAVRLQTAELALQRQELAATREELRMQREAQQEQAKTQAEALDVQRLAISVQQHAATIAAAALEVNGARLEADVALAGSRQLLPDSIIPSLQRAREAGTHVRQTGK